MVSLHDLIASLSDRQEFGPSPDHIPEQFKELSLICTSLPPSPLFLCRL